MAAGSKQVQSRIRWNEEEKAKLIARGRELTASGAANTPLDAIRAAQDVLPSDRRRKLATLTQAPWFSAGVRKRGAPSPASAVGAGISKDDLKSAIVEAVLELMARLGGGEPRRSVSRKRG